MAAAAQIPVIDIADPDQEKAARELVDAAVTHGFVYIKNEGKDIPVDAIENAFNLSKKLFASPTEEKQPCAIQKNNRGWSGMHVETLDPANQRVGDFKEAFNFGEFIDNKPQQPIPPVLTSHESEIASFFSLCRDLSLKLNTLLGIGLEVDPPTFFHRAHLPSLGPSGNTLRWLYYPPPSSPSSSPTSPEDIRAGAHSDYGSLTLLFRIRGQAGLEVLTPPPSQTWAPVPVLPPGTDSDPAPPILVNIGDLLSYWTGGLLRSTVHRVVFPSAATPLPAAEPDAGPRYSMAFFCHPAGSAALEPVPSERVRAFVASDDAAARAAAVRDGNPYADRREKVLTADEHLQMRLRASYLTLYDDGKEEEKGEGKEEVVAA